MNKFYQNLKISLPSCKDVEKKKATILQHCTATNATINVAPGK